jgi:hypothetical protein
MDPRRFDTLAKTLSTSGTRRGALTALLAGTLGLLGLSQPAQGRKRRGDRDVTIQGPCGDGSGPDNVCERPRDCCTGICERSQPDKPKRCRCRRRDQPCTQSRNCCQGAGQDLVCDGGTCQPPCTSDSCATGCCDGTTCQEGNTIAACGQNGVACTSCADGRVCVGNGLCAFGCGPGPVNSCSTDGHCGRCEPNLSGGPEGVCLTEHRTCTDDCAKCAADGRVCFRSGSPCPGNTACGTPC